MCLSVCLSIFLSVSVGLYGSKIRNYLLTVSLSLYVGLLVDSVCLSSFSVLLLVLLLLYYCWCCCFFIIVGAVASLLLLVLLLLYYCWCCCFFIIVGAVASLLLLVLLLLFAASGCTSVPTTTSFRCCPDDQRSTVTGQVDSVGPVITHTGRLA